MGQSRAALRRAVALRQFESRQQLFDGAPLLVIFDGDCSLCTCLVAWLERQDRAGRLWILPNQTPGLLAAVGLTEREAATSVWAIEETGARYAGAPAIHRTLRELDGRFWMAFSLLPLVPGVRWVEGRVYAWVSRYRGHLAWPASATRCGARGSGR